jgi:hypothetical protein
LVFELDDDLIGDGRIERYEVVVSDGRGISASVQPWALQEDVDEAPKA